MSKFAVPPRASAAAAARPAVRPLDRRAAAASGERPPGRDAACACGGGCPRCAPVERPGGAARLSPVATQGPSPFPGGVPSGAGQGLPEPSRSRLERRFGADLGSVRLHVDEEAARLGAGLGARAFAYGRDVFVPPAHYRPGSPAGERLLAHEVAHTIQQAKGRPTIQREEAPPGSQPASKPAIAASAMFGLPAGAHVVIARTMEDALFSLLSSQAPDVATSLTAVSGQQATVATASDDLVELLFDEPVTLPAVGQTPARTIRDLKIRLARDAAGNFDFEIVGSEGDKGAVVSLYSETGLTPRADGGGYVLSAGTEAHLRLTPAASATGSASIEAYTAPYLKGQPGFVKSLAPTKIGLVSATGLPSAPAGSAAQKKQIEKILSDAKSKTAAPPRQTLTVGAGIAGGFGLHPLLRASWRYGFEPSKTATSLLQIPLQVDLFYAPTPSVFGAVTSGVGTSLSTLRIPLNVRLTAGLGGGSVEDEKKGSVGVFGPTVGAGVGYESGWFRIEARWDQLINVLPGPGPGSIPTGSLNLGGAF